MKISLLTATGHYNLGDELILLQEYKYLKEFFGEETKFNIFTYEEKSSLLPKDENIKFLYYFPKNIRKNPFKNIGYLWENISSIAKSNLVIIGGGGLIYGSEIQKGGSPIGQWKLRILLAKIFRKKIIWLAVGISYPEKKINDLKFLFSGKKNYVSVRDKESQKTLEKIGIKSNLLSDPVFSLNPINCLFDKVELSQFCPPDKGELKGVKKSEFEIIQDENNPPTPLVRGAGDGELIRGASEKQKFGFLLSGEGQTKDLEIGLLDCHDFLQKSRNDETKNIDSKTSSEGQTKKVVGISLRKGYLQNEMENIKQLILFLSKKGYEIVFISHSIHQDDKLADDYEFVREIAKIYGIRVTKTIKETLQIYTKLDYVIGMRFHSMILSIIYNIPFIALSYGVKTQELLKDFDYINFAINPKNFSFEDFIHKFEKLEISENESKFALKKKYDIIKHDFYLNFNNFFNGLEISKK